MIVVTATKKNGDVLYTYWSDYKNQIIAFAPKVYRGGRWHFPKHVVDCGDRGTAQMLIDEWHTGYPRLTLKIEEV